MRVSHFIAGHLKIKGRIAVVSIAISFLVMIIAVAVTGGFKKELRSGISQVFGDVQLSADGNGYLGGDNPVKADTALTARLLGLRGVKKVTPVVYKPGIIKNGDNIQGVIFKGTPQGPDSLGVRVPRQLCSKLALSLGDKMTVYFAGEKVRVRVFRIVEVYPAALGGEDKLIVETSLSQMQTVCGWSSDEVSALEVVFDALPANSQALEEATSLVGTAAWDATPQGERPPVASSVSNRFPQIFSWLELLDVNVLLVLALMTAVAGFNMISGLLITLFRNISSIGVLKAIGMKNRDIGDAFLRMSFRVVLKGMAAGNILGIGFCLLQKHTHLIKLDPENYFLSYMPVNLDIWNILVTDVAAFCLIALMLLLPTLFISGVDPAKTIKVR